MHTVMKTWGYEKWIENNSEYCCKLLHVLPKKFCSVHFHKKKKETFYITKGSFFLKVFVPDKKDIEVLKNFDGINLNDELTAILYKFDNSPWNYTLTEGESFSIDRYTLHTFSSASKMHCEFIEASTYHEDSDSYRLRKST